MSVLLLVPTALERDRLQKHFPTETRWDLCGFGVIAAAARASQLIQQHQPSHVILAGIAGSVGAKLSVGSAHWFDEVQCVGIGVGSGDGFRSAQSIGWPHFVPDQGESIGDRLSLSNPVQSDTQLRLRTVCAASSGADQYPAEDANAEDMEGFAVAFACRINDVPCSIVRGISNRVGDRNHSNWDIDGAICAVATLMLNSPWIEKSA